MDINIPLDEKINKQPNRKILSNNLINYGMIGLGGCGTKLIENFEKLGYNKTLIIHNSQDKLNASDCLYLEEVEDNVSKTVSERHERIFAEHQKKIYEKINLKFGKNIEQIEIITSISDGFGASGLLVILELLKYYFLNNGYKNVDKRVGIIAIVPEQEKIKNNKNILLILNKLSEVANNNLLSHLILIDNQELLDFFPDDKNYEIINKSISGLFHFFNNLPKEISAAKKELEFHTFKDILTCGKHMMVSLTAVSEVEMEMDMYRRIIEKIEVGSLFKGYGLNNFRKGVLVFVGNDNVLNLPGLNDNIEQIIENIKGNNENCELDYAIYRDDKENMRIYSLIGGLDTPENKYKNIEKILNS